MQPVKIFPQVHPPPVPSPSQFARLSGSPLFPIPSPARKAFPRPPQAPPARLLPSSIFQFKPPHLQSQEPDAKVFCVVLPAEVRSLKVECRRSKSTGLVSRSFSSASKTAHFLATPWPLRVPFRPAHPLGAPFPVRLTLVGCMQGFQGARRERVWPENWKINWACGSIKLLPLHTPALRSLRSVPLQLHHSSRPRRILQECLTGRCAH